MNEQEALVNMLRKGPSRNVKNLVGQRFDRLRVLEWAGSARNRSALWLCRCKCGVNVVVPSSSLRTRNTRSCGCLHLDTVTTHGESSSCRTGGSAEYRIWNNMRQRCENPNNPDFDKYGGRGICVVERWRQFENFLADVGRRPSPKHSLDRRDNDGPYSPDNCVWATKKVQNRNKRTNHNVTFRGRTMCLTAWAEELGMNPVTLFHRLKHWPPEVALTKPVQKKRESASTTRRA